MIWLWTLAWAVVATAGGVLAPDQMRLMISVGSTQSAGEVVIPVGHWIVVMIWTAGAIWLSNQDRRQVLLRCIAVGLAWHAFVLLASFVPRLSDREAFSASVYLIYARLFCAGAIAIGAVWLFHWIARGRRQASALTVLETPILFGWLALVAAVARYSAAMAAVSLAAGAAAAAAMHFGGRLATRRPADVVRATLSHEGVFVAAVFVAALALRLLYMTRIMSDANYLDAGSDGRAYDQLAWSLASGQGIPSWYTDRFPMLLLGYVYFVAAVYKIAGHSPLAIMTVQAVLGAATCVLLYNATALLFGRAVARVAAVFTAVSFPLVFAAATIGHQPLDVFLTVLVFWMAVRIAGSNATPLKWAALGVVTGLSIVVRETAAFLAAFLAAWIAFTNPLGWKRSLPDAAAFVVAAVMVVLPFAAPKVWTADDRQAIRGHFDRIYRAGLEGEIRETPRTDIVGPVAVARAYAANVGVLFLTQPYGGFDLVFLRKGTEYYYAMWFYAYALTVAGAIVLLRWRRSGRVMSSGVILILGVIASRTLPHVMLESGYRHRVPIEPFLIMLASVGAVAVYRAVMATAASVNTSGLTGSDWRVSHSSGT